MFNYVVIQHYTIIDNISNIPKLMTENYIVWIERVLLHLGYADINYAIKNNEPPIITNVNFVINITFYEY